MGAQVIGGGVMRRFGGLVGRELRLVLRGGSDAATAVAFFAIVAALFPLGVGPEPNLLARIAAGVLMVAALLATLLSVERLFLGDWEDGSLDLLALAPLPLEATVLAKAAAHWLTTGLPVIAAGPVLATMLGLPAAALPALIAALALATPSLSLVGAAGAALVLGARRGGALIAVLVLPLFVPVLVFAAAAVDAAAFGLSPRPHLLLLAGMLAVALPLGPVAGAAALRQAIESG
jgi:heme exporter protein B